MVKFVPTTCPYCGAGCGMLLVVKDGSVIDTQPWSRHPISRGELCIKGWNAHQFIHHRDRLQKPQIKENNRFREATWEEALQLVANRFKQIKKEMGPDSLAVLASAKGTNEENYVAQKFTRAVLGTNNIDHCARLCHASTVAGLAQAFGSGAMTNSVPDIEEANCIFIIGSNTSSQHPLIATRIWAAKEKGARIIVADPRKIQLCEIADIYLPMKSGTDVALLNGMMKVIIDQGLEDKEFIKERTEGFDELLKILEQVSLAEIAEITQVPAEDIEKAARIYAQAERASLIYSMGITQHTTGTDNVMSTANLAMLTGNLGKPGTGVNPLRGQNNVQGACDMGSLPNVFSGYQAVINDELRAKMAKAWGVAELPAKVGLTLIEMMNAAASGELKAMYIIGENPLLSDPDINHVRQALEKLDFLVVQDIFPTEVTAVADVILPAACWAEQDGTFTNTDRRVQRVRKAVDPPGEARPDWQITCQLAGLMGASDLFAFTSAEEIFAEACQVTPLYHGMSYKALEQPDGLQWPCPSEGHPGTTVLHQQQFSRGKGKFHPVAYREPAEVPDKSYPYLLTTGRVISQWHTGSMTRRSPALESEFPEAFIEINPGDARELGIKDSEQVEVSSRRGKIQLKALVTDKIKQGIVFIPFHYAESAANVLTNPALDPVAKIPELKVCAVKIQKGG
ncbi:Formate dehydrogenase H [subsurface metagenome]